MDEDKPDIEIGALGTGCLTSCGTGCVSVVIVLGLAVAAGVNFARVTPESIPGWIHFIGFLLGLAGYVVVGYVTARAAPRAPIFHAMILGIILMVVGILGIVLPAIRSLPGQSGPDFWVIISWLLTIPLMLWGANIWDKQNHDLD